MDAKKRKNLIALSIVAGSLVLLLLLLLWLRTLSPSFSEFVCRYIARPYVFIAGHITSLFPLSFFEFCIIVVIFGAVALITLAIVGLVRKLGALVLKGALIVVICILSVFNLYSLIVGFSYYRPAAPVPQSEKEYASQDVTKMLRYFADDFNELAGKFERDGNGNVKSPYSLSELSDKLRAEYERLGNDYYYGYTPKAKGIVNSWWLTLNNISGITFVPLGEPTVNRNTPASDIPQTMAHEMAHAKGVMREGEANFVAYYLLLSSDDDYLRYCGYFSTFYSALTAVNADSNKKTDYNEIRNGMAPEIRNEIIAANKFWSEKSKQPGIAGFLNRVFEKVGDFMNDIFLKSNGAENGSGSYSDKVTDGEISDTGQTNPDTGEIIYAVTYSSVQKMYFAVYEQRAT